MFLMVIQLHENAGTSRERMVENEGACVKIEIFHNEVLRSDHSIHLHHCSEMYYILPSKQDVFIVAALQEYGLVEHTMWTEINDKP